MPFTSVAKCNSWVESRERCVVPFWHNHFVFGVRLVVLGSGFRGMTERSQDMGDGSVLKMIGDIERGMVEFENGDDPEHRNHSWYHDTSQGEVGEHSRFASLSD